MSPGVPAWLLIVLSGCTGLSDARAEELVREYDRRLAEAYRTADPELLTPVAGQRERAKVSALIGAKADMGLALEAELVELKLVGVERGPEGPVVSADEEWHYRDRRIGSGEQVGQPSQDFYRMKYFLQREGERWVVGRVEWGAPPRVGRTEALGSGLRDAGAGEGVSP